MIYLGMCKHYEYRGRPWCVKLQKRANLRCHSENKECPCYEPDKRCVVGGLDK